MLIVLKYHVQKFMRIAICVNVASYMYKVVFCRDTVGIIGKCCEFLKKDGILVTDSLDANSVPELARQNWKCINICPKSGCLHKSNVYKKICS